MGTMGSSVLCLFGMGLFCSLPPRASSMGLFGLFSMGLLGFGGLGFL